MSKTRTIWTSEQTELLTALYPSTPNWKLAEMLEKTAPGYSALHQWVYRIAGKASKCEHCAVSGLRPRQYEWANKSRQYKRDINDWLQLCVRCHRKYDGIGHDNLGRFTKNSVNLTRSYGDTF